MQPQGDLKTQREKLSDDQELNEAGGYCYVIDKLERVKRFLFLGTELPSYRARGTTHHSEYGLADVPAIDWLIQRGDGGKVVEWIKTISVSGRACKQDPAIYALAVCARSNCPTTKYAAYSVLNDVCRIPTHLFLFIKYCEEMSPTETGWGRAHRMAICNWYKQFNSPDENSPKHPLKLAYLVTKYQRRHRLSHKDVIRLAHIQTRNRAIRIIIQYVLGKDMENVETDKTATIVKNFIESVIFVKRCQPNRDEGILCEQIAIHQLSREHIPNKFLKENIINIGVWRALIPLMPMTAMIRNLGKLTRIAMNSGNEFCIELAEIKLKDESLLSRSRIHPLNLLIAKKHYEIGVGKKRTFTWSPHPRIVQALDTAFIQMTKLTKSTGKRYLMAVSIGEAMDNKVCGSSIKAREAAAAMVLSTVQTNYVETILFRDNIEEAYIAKIDRTDDLKSLEDKMFRVPRRTGLDRDGHDLNTPFKWAFDRKEKFDSIIIFTDSLTSMGLVHPAEGLSQYRTYMAADNCRLVVVAMTTDRYTIAAPDDQRSLDVIGFDTHTPGIIMEFLEGFNSDSRDNVEDYLHEDEAMDIVLH